VSVLRVENLSKHFGGLEVLSSISFEVEEGEKLALIGPNGAGKSTLINAVAGQSPVSGGEVYLGDKRITKLAAHKRLHLGMGRSFQVNNLFIELSVLDNMLLALHGAEKSHVHMAGTIENRHGLLDQADELLDRVGLADRKHRILHTLSYGDQRLVELLCAFAAKPKLVLLDEPSAGLPTAEAFTFANTIRRLAEDTTVLFCAHDMDLVFSLADTIMVLYGGSIIARGAPQEISKDPKVREIYLGSRGSA
jgi:branched-chain amino acid transport system ATP-binding protein